MLYFGCKGDIGHYLWTWDHSPSRKYEKNLQEAGLWNDIDKGFCPKGPQRQGAYKLTHMNGWTILAFWDRSVDPRPGSHSTFLKHGEWAAEEMLYWAGQLHPDVIARQPVAPFPVEVL
jgi:hypothetical protein